jgi:hypothetical protein
MRGFENMLKNLLKPKKFICLNDNINYAEEGRARELQTVVTNFYQMFLPAKSRFELR